MNTFAIDSVRLKLLSILLTAGLVGALGTVAYAQGSCPNGLITGISTSTAGQTSILALCPTVLKTDPAVAQKLKELVISMAGQKDALDRVLKSVNSLSQNIGDKRQDELLKSLVNRLSESQKSATEAQAASGKQVNERLASLADGLDSLRDMLLQVLTNRKTSEKVNDALDGPVGDAISRLDLRGAQAMLEDIQKQLADIHTDTRETNERTKQIQGTLSEIQIEPAKIRDALTSADMTLLGRLTLSKNTIRSIEAGLRQTAAGNKLSVADQFFATSNTSVEAEKWFDAILTAGLNPNLLVEASYYRQEGILNAAVRAGNVEMVKSLLLHGANPHAYENLYLTPYTMNRFLFPLQAIATDDGMSLESKREIVQAFLRAGVVIPQVITSPGNSGYQDMMFAAKRAEEATASSLGMPLPASKTLCEQPAPPVCKAASARTGEDWCRRIAEFPKVLTHATVGGTTPLSSVTLQYLLGISDPKIYFLGLTDSYGPDYVLVEVSKDASTWNVLHFMAPAASMGLCRKDDDQNFQPERCWRSIPMHRSSGAADVLQFDTWGQSWTLSQNACSTAVSPGKAATSHDVKH